MTDMDLGALAPPEARLSLGDREYVVTPLVGGELPAMLKSCRPILAHLAESDFLGAFVEDADAVLEAVSIAARLPRQEVDALPLDVLAELAGVCIEINVDFFSRSVAPALERAFQRIRAAQDGSMPSPALSGQDSGSAT